MPKYVIRAINMSNAEIIEQWKKAEETASQNIVRLINESGVVGDELNKLERQKSELVLKKRQLETAGILTTDIDAKIAQLDSQIEPLNVKLDQIDSQKQEYQTALRNAKREYEKAQSAPADTVNNTSPIDQETQTTTSSLTKPNSESVTEEKITDDQQQIEIAGSKLKKLPDIIDTRSDENGVDPVPERTPNFEQPPTPELDLPPSEPNPVAEPVFEQPPTPELDLPPSEPNPVFETPPAPPPPPKPVIITAAKKPIPDWRFRISLADSANYFYNTATDSDILFPLKATNGVIFPYTPSINITYAANYESSDITHSNYKVHNYRNSSIDSITITGDFTAQDSTEAEYVLAVIHFFRTVTKMFYGKDSNPKAGTPPPLCYLTGHGAYAFDKHPVAITSFTLNYPTDVDYISTRDNSTNVLPTYTKPVIGKPTRLQRLLKSGLGPGGTAAKSGNSPTGTQTNTKVMTRIPSKLQITLNAIPIVTRNNISNNFSLEKYATGQLLISTINPRGGGIW